MLRSLSSSGSSLKLKRGSWHFPQLFPKRQRPRSQPSGKSRAPRKKVTHISEPAPPLICSCVDRAGWTSAGKSTQRGYKKDVADCLFSKCQQTEIVGKPGKRACEQKDVVAAVTALFSDSRMKPHGAAVAEVLCRKELLMEDLPADVQPIAAQNAGLLANAQVQRADCNMGLLSRWCVYRYCRSN